MVCHIEYPVLLDKDNFMCFFDENFTGRASYTSNDEKSLNDAEELVANAGMLEGVNEFSESMFSQWFDIEVVVDRYIKIYENALPD